MSAADETGLVVAPRKTTRQEKETAQINAEAKLIEAQAQADANRLISQSLTPELIQQQMYEKWNGQLPTVQAGNDASIIVDASDMAE